MDSSCRFRTLDELLCVLLFGEFVWSSMLINSFPDSDFTECGAGEASAGGDPAAVSLGVPTHFLFSYLFLMKFCSLFVSRIGRLNSSGSFASRILLASLLDFIFTRLTRCSSCQMSKSTDLTLLICVPNDRCTPAHLMQTKTPNDHDAHLGCDEFLQSAQHELPGSLSRPFNAFLTLGGVDMILKAIVSRPNEVVWR